MKNERATSKVAAIILAGGSGKRAGGTYKQFSKVNGRALIFYSIKPLINSTFIDSIIIVVPKEKITYAYKLLSQYRDGKVKIVAGGITRKQSSYNALKYIANSSTYPKFVIFHEAARPFLSTNMLRAILGATKRYDAAAIVTKPTSLILKTKQSIVTGFANKHSYFLCSTPQCFRFRQIFDAHNKFKNINSKAIGNIELLRQFNKNARIRVIAGFYQPLKITYKEDLKIAGVLLKLNTESNVGL